MRARVVVAFALCLSLPTVLACTEKEPEEKQRKRKSSASETPTQAATPEPAKPEPSATTSEPDTPPSEPPQAWWCVCYRSESETGPQPASACRAQEKQCRALEKRIARGGGGIVAGSLTHGCRTIVGAHPGDAAGGREAWKPSKLAGAWTAEGACLLEGEAAPPPSDTSEQNQPSEPGPDAFAWLSDETIGPLRDGMGTIEVVDLLGAPPEKGEIFEEGATGMWVQEWKYPNAGVSLWMHADTERGAQSIAAITVKAPCEYATKRGIKVGSTRAELDKAYGDVKDQDGFGDDEPGSFVAGSVYGGIIFGLEDGKVSEIFMGAAAE
jgi:hypothetical protein